MEEELSAEKVLGKAMGNSFRLGRVPDEEGCEARQNFRVDGEENLHSVSISCDSGRESLEMEIGKGYEPKVEEVTVDVYKGSGENAELVNSRKRRKVGGGDIEDESKKVVDKVKKELMDDKLRGSGRILRSSFAVKIECGSVTDSEENSSSMAVQNCRSRRCGKKIVKLERGNDDQLPTGTQKLKRKRGRPPKVEKEAEALVVSPRKKLKRKPGRPPKSESENTHPFVCGSKKKLKKKRGRPRKIEMENDNPLFGELNTLKRKRGRPPKLQQNNGALKDERTEGRKVNWARKLDVRLRNRLRSNVPTDSLSSDKRHIRKEIHMKRTLPAEKVLALEYTEPEAALTTSSKVIACSDKIKEVKKVETPKIKVDECGRSAAKHLLRERITEILKTAGWTVEYRPRFNREYKDAVYVSPEGRTHWSITLAYNVLKKHYEEGDGDSKIYKTGFMFTPIPDEEIMTLTRITKARKNKELKQRRDQGKRKKKGFIERTKCKEKANSRRSPVSKSTKRKRKRNTLPHELENSDHNLEKEFPSSFRTKNRKRCRLLVRNNEESINSSNDGYLLYNGKRTLLTWMIDLEILSLDEKVQYMNQRKTRVKLEGRLTRDGIHCDCCGEVITLSKFEMHAGSRLGQPLENIYVQSGSPLLQCLLESWNKQNEPQRKGYHFVDVDLEDPNDDTCGICGDGGDLICCDSCPSTFHQSCLDIKKFPSGHWHCLYCSCKLCGQVTTGLHPMDERHEAPTAVLYKCQLCEEKYHPICVKTTDASGDDVNDRLFCGKKCQMLHERLQMLLGVKQEMEEGFSWTLVNRSDVGSDVSLCSEVAQKIKCNSKLAVALFVMDECFLPIIDHRSGVNLIHNILYNCGSNFTRLNFGGFYTAILEKDDEVICAASLRIHGNELAEMPFIGTRYMYRRQGMCRRFLSEIELALSSLKVEKLVIPAIFELRETWTSIFGFEPLEETIKQRMRSMNLLVFPGVEMLQKPLFRVHLPMERTPLLEGCESSQLAEHHTLEEVVASSPEERRSPGSGLSSCSKGTAHDGFGISGEPAVVEPSLKLNDKILNDIPDLDNPTNNVEVHTMDVLMGTAQDGFGISIEPAVVESSFKLNDKILNDISDLDNPTNNVKVHTMDVSKGTAPDGFGISGEPAVVESSFKVNDKILNDISDLDNPTNNVEVHTMDVLKGTAQDGFGISGEPAVAESSFKVNDEILNDISDLDNPTNNVEVHTKDVIDHNLEERNKENSLCSSCLTCGDAKEIGQYQTTSLGSIFSDPGDWKSKQNGHLSQDRNSAIHQKSGLECSKGTGSDDRQEIEVSVPNDKLKSTHDVHVNQLGTISTGNPQETASVPDGPKVFFNSEIASGCFATSQMDGKISSPAEGDRLNAAHVISVKVCSNRHPREDVALGL